jgi:lysine 2,3-aminomutase
MPQRITPALTDVLKRYHPLFMSIHFTHPRELTPEAEEACSRLADAGIPLGSQTVLLKGINDSAEVLTRLFRGLLRLRVRPYYLYQCDLVRGSKHFRTTVEKGLEIMDRIQGFTSGYAVPKYVVDAPEGGGKIPLFSKRIVAVEGREVKLRNYEGKLFTYVDPD